MYYIYILKCENGELYTGITPDLKRRLHEHFTKSEKCAKYTRSHPPVSVESVWVTETKGAALSLEYRIKSLTKKNKEMLIEHPEKLSEFFEGRIDAAAYDVYKGEVHEKKYYTTHDSPIGKTVLMSDGTHLTGLYFLNENSEENSKYVPDISKFQLESELQIFHDAARWLDIYFGGGVPDFTPDIKLSGTDFQKTVWEELLKIPYGETVCYSDIAKKIAHRKNIQTMSSQAVGGAVGRNPISIIVPCHRVMGKDGSLTGYAGGLWRKEYLLKLEKVL